MSEDKDELYLILGVAPNASQDEIIAAYKKEIASYEKASKRSRKDARFKEADTRYREVSKAFVVLCDPSRRQQYDAGYPVSSSPKTPSKISKQRTEYQVKFNEQSVTIFLPQNVTKSWLSKCEKHYGVRATDGGKNGQQIKTSFVDARSHQPLGSVSIKFYNATDKLLIQGSAYLLWYSEVFPELQKSINVTRSNNNAAHIQASMPKVDANSSLVDLTSAVTYPMPCPSCQQPVVSDFCDACNTVPKDVLDVNSNNVNGSTSGTTESNMADKSVTSDFSIVQESVSKLETCIANCITGRKLFEDSVMQRLSMIEARVKTCEQPHLCEGLSSKEKDSLLNDIAHLYNVKRELEVKVKSLEQSYEMLSASLGKAEAACLNRQGVSAETQTTDDSSERADRLLREFTTTSITVQNRFNVLDNNLDNPDAILETSQRSAKPSYDNENRHPCRDHNRSQRGEKRGAETHVSRTKQTSGVASDSPGNTIHANQQNNGAPLDILIVGDSNTRPIQSDIMYPGKSVRKEVTFNLTQATAFIETASIPDPKVIIFHVGTNDARDHKDPTVVSEGFRSLLHSAHDKFPQSSLVLSAIPPRGDRNLQAVGDKVNAFLKVVAEETSHIHLVDNSNLSQNGGINRSLFNYDGYHLNRFGTRVLVSNIKKTVNPLLSIGQYTNGGARSANVGRNPTHVNEGKLPAKNSLSIHGTMSYRDAVIRPSNTGANRLVLNQRTSPLSPDPTSSQVQGQGRPSSTVTPDHSSRHNTGCTSGKDRPSTQGQARGALRPSQTPTNSEEVTTPAPQRRATPVGIPPPLFANPQGLWGPWGPPPVGPWGPPPVGLWGPPPYMIRHPPGPWGMPPPIIPTPGHSGRFPDSPRRADMNYPPAGHFPLQPPPWAWQPGMLWGGPPSGNTW